MSVKLVFDPGRPASVQLKISPVVALLTYSRYCGYAAVADERAIDHDGEPASLVHVTPREEPHRRHGTAGHCMLTAPRKAESRHKRAHHARALRPSRVHDLLEADLAHRMRRLTEGGLGRLFSEMLPWVEFDDEVLRVNTRCHDETLTRTSGLTLMPTLLSDRVVLLVPESFGPPVLLYPAQDADGDRRTVPAQRDWARRADLLLRLLLFLRRPRTVDEMAYEQCTDADGIWPHLDLLSKGGLLVTRQAPTVRYERTPVASALVAPSCPYCA